MTQKRFRNSMFEIGDLVELVASSYKDVHKYGIVLGLDEYTMYPKVTICWQSGEIISEHFGDLKRID